MKLQYKLLSEHAVPPTKAHEGDAGFDLCVVEATRIEAGRTQKLSTGLCLAVPAGYYGDIRARSSTTVRGLACAGIVDSGYRGTVYLLCTNTSLYAVDVKVGDRLCQMLVLPVPAVEAEEVEELDSTARGTGAFGSTGASGRPAGASG